MDEENRTDADRWPEVMAHMLHPNQTIQAFELPAILDLAWQEIHRRIIDMMLKHDDD